MCEIRPTLDTRVNPLLHVTPNVEMNTNLMEQSWRNKVRKFMFISSNTTYPDVGDEYCTEDMNVQTPNIYPVYKVNRLDEEIWRNSL